MGDSIQGAKRTILNRFKSESLTNRFWIENLSGSQFEHLPLKSVEEFEQILQGINVQDMQMLVELFDFNDDNMTSCVGITASQPPPGMSV